MRSAALLSMALFGVGCAREAMPSRPMQPIYYPGSVHAWTAPPPGAIPLTQQPHYAALTVPPVVEVAAPVALPTPSAASRPDVPFLSSAEIPSDDACLAELAKTKIVHHRLDEKRGVSTPVEVSGKIGGISFERSMVADCRFVLALHRIAPVLAELGVNTMRFSGAYTYRMSRVGRLSLHAHGLALDVHEVRFGSKWQSVEKDFARGLADGCASSSPALNQLACRLKATRLFKELLTPDYNADHANHLHLAIASTDLPKPVVSRPKPKPRVIAEPEPPVDDGEPTVELEPETTPPKSPPNARKQRPKAKPTRPAKHRPLATSPGPIAS